MLIKKHITIFAIFLQTVLLFGQERFYNVYNFTQRETGMDILNFEIVQDYTGMLWMRDYHKIGKFNGRKYENMTAKLEQVAGNNLDIYDIHVDVKGELWVSGSRGIYRYRSDKFSQIKVNNPPNTQFTAINDTKISILAGTQKGVVYIIDKKNYIIQHEIKLPEETIIKCITQIGQHIWVAAHSGVFTIDMNQRVKKIHTFSSYEYEHTFTDNRYQKIKQLSDGTVIANDHSNKVFLFNKDGGVEDSLEFNIKQSDRAVNDWIELPDKTIFFATTEMPYLYDRNTKQLRQKSNQYLINHQFDNTSILSVINTRNNVIYTGGALSLSKLNFLNEIFNNYNFGKNSKTVLVKEIPGLANNWLIVTEKDGILLNDQIQNTVVPLLKYESGYCDNAIYEEKSETLWLSMTNKVHKYKITPSGIKKLGSFPKKGKTTGISVHNDSIWIVSDGILYFINQDDKTIEQLSDTGIPMFGLSHDTKGNLFAGGQKLYIVKNKKLYHVQTNLFPSGLIYSIAADDKGNVFFGKGRNLYKYNYETKVLKQFTPQNGLPNESLGWMMHDHTEGLWLCTSASGLCRFDTQKEKISYFKENEGLTDNIYLFGLSRIKKGVIAAHRWGYFSHNQPQKKFNNSKLANTKFMDSSCFAKDAPVSSVVSI